MAAELQENQIHGEVIPNDLGGYDLRLDSKNAVTPLGHDANAVTRQIATTALQVRLEQGETRITRVSVPFRTQGGHVAFLHWKPQELDTTPIQFAAEGIQAAVPVTLEDDLAPAMNPSHYYGNPDVLTRSTFNESDVLLDNVAAIRLLKQLEKAPRPATEDEKTVLAKYAGWGGLPNLFAMNPGNIYSSGGYGLSGDRYRRAFIALHPTLAQTGAPDGYFLQSLRNEPGAGKYQAENLLTEEEWASARSSVTNAHFTSPDVIRAIWDALEPALPQGELRILEPSAGVGNFLTFAPRSVVDRAWFTAVELDTITGRILQQIHPNARVHVRGFEDAPLPDGYYDLIISNVPFGDYPIPDRRYGGGKRTVHNYFFERGVDLLRPSGQMVGITSRYSLDARDGKVRESIATKADLVQAVRLPVDSQTAQAGVEVTMDILFLRRLAAPRTIAEVRALDLPWLKSGTVEIEISSARESQLKKRGFEHPNQFYATTLYDAHPEWRLGTYATGSGRAGIPALVVRGDRAALAEQIREALTVLPHRLQESAARDAAIPIFGSNADGIDHGTPSLGVENLLAHEDIREMIGTVVRRKDTGALGIVDGSNFDEDGNKRLVVSDMPVYQSRTKLWERYLPLRDAWRECLKQARETEPGMDGHEHPAMLQAQNDLNTAYDLFVEAHGPLNKFKKQLADDIHIAAVSSIERYDEYTKTAQKTAIFSQRAFAPTQEPDHVEHMEDAISLSINRFGRLDLPYMAEKLDQTDDVVRTALLNGNPPLAFVDPESREILPDYQYLSGNIRQKLRVIQTLIDSGEEASETWAKNRTALETVLPDDIAIADVDILLGADWVPESMYTEFVSETLDDPRACVLRSTVDNTWSVHANPQTQEIEDRFGTARRKAVDLLERNMNRADIRIYDTIDKKQVLNGEQTMLANDKAKEIREAWKEWLPKDAARMQTLERIYNDRFSGIVPIKVRGDGLQVEGMNGAIILRDHQNSAVMRCVLQDRCLLNHEVGTGKTYTQIAAGMKLLDLGLVDRAIFALPKKTMPQFAGAAIALFPNRRFAVMDDTQTSDADRKRRFLAGLANDHYDGIILTYEGFKKISVPAEFEEAFYMAEVNALDDLLDAAKESDDRFSVKRMENSRKNKLAKIDIIRKQRESGADGQINGADVLGKRPALFVDEFHNFKNDEVSVPGSSLGINPSVRAFDMRLKSRYILDLGGRFYGASGTPVANHLLEFYVLQRYFQEDTLRQMGVSDPLSWFQNFLDLEAEAEPDPAGQGWRVKERPYLVNAAEAVIPLTEIMDTVRADEANIERPTPHYETRVIHNSDFLDACMAEASARLKAIRDKKVAPAVDNILVVLNMLNKAGLDPRMLNPNAWVSPDTPCKINEVTQDVVQLLVERDGYGLQLIFCDMGIPKRAKDRKITNETGEEIEMGEEELAGITDFCFYDALIDQLVEKGVPRHRIATIYDAGTDAELDALLGRANAGEISVMLGSTMTMGVGLNVQIHITDIRFLTVPYRPDQVEQAIGRGLRQGNQNSDIHVKFYTQGQPEAYRYRLLDYKSKALKAVLQADRTVRRLDLSSNLNYAETMAMTMGDPRLAEVFQKEDQLAKLQTLRKSHYGRRNRYTTDLHYLADDVKVTALRLNRMQAFMERAAAVPEDALWSGKMLDGNGVGPLAVTMAMSAFFTKTVSPFAHVFYGDLPVRVRRTQFDTEYDLLNDQDEIVCSAENPSQLQKMVRAWPETMDALQKRIEDMENRIAELNVLMKKPFAREGEMQALLAEVALLRIATGMEENADEKAIADAEKRLESLAQARGERAADNAADVVESVNRERVAVDPEALRQMFPRAQENTDAAAISSRKGGSKAGKAGKVREMADPGMPPMRRANAPGIVFAEPMAHVPVATPVPDPGKTEQEGLGLFGATPIPPMVVSADASAVAYIAMIVGYDVRDWTEYRELIRSTVLSAVPDGLPVHAFIVNQDSHLDDETLGAAFAGDFADMTLFHDGGLTGQQTACKRGDLVVTLGSVLNQKGRRMIPFAERLNQPGRILGYTKRPAFGFAANRIIQPNDMDIGEVFARWGDLAAKLKWSASVVLETEATSEIPSQPVSVADIPRSVDDIAADSGFRRVADIPMADPASRDARRGDLPAMSPPLAPAVIRRIPESVRGFLPRIQRLATESALPGEEGAFFANKLQELKEIIATMPKTYETDGQGDDAVVYLHYFSGSVDWYITEKDAEDRQLQAFGLADLGQGFPEMGYINIEELVAASVEMDYHFAPRTLRQLKQEKYPELLPVPAAMNAGDAGVLFYRGGPDSAMPSGAKSIESIIDYERNEKALRATLLMNESATSSPAVEPLTPYLETLKDFLSADQLPRIAGILAGESDVMSPELAQVKLARLAQWVQDAPSCHEAQQSGLDGRCLMVYHRAGHPGEQDFLTGLDRSESGIQAYGLAIRAGTPVLGPIDLPAIVGADGILSLSMDPGPLWTFLRELGYAPDSVRHDGTIIGKLHGDPQKWQYWESEEVPAGTVEAWEAAAARIGIGPDDFRQPVYDTAAMVEAMKQSGMDITPFVIGMTTNLAALRAAINDAGVETHGAQTTDHGVLRSKTAKPIGERMETSVPVAVEATGPVIAPPITVAARSTRGSRP